MKTAWIKNLLLVALVTALALYVLYKPNPQDEIKRFELSTLPKAAVTKIVIEPKGGARIELSKQGDEWLLVQPVAARADRTQVDRMLDVLTARSNDKLAASDLQRFDLDAPAMRVTFNDQSFAFGTASPVGGDQYVHTGDGVYLVAPYFRSLVPDDAKRLLTHALLRADEKPVGFVLPEFSVQQQDGKWTLTPAPASEKDRLSQDDFNRWVDDWKLASSLLTQPTGEQQAKEWIELHMADGKTVRLGVLQREPELVLVRSDEKLSFYYSSETSKRLMSAPMPAPAPEAPANTVPPPAQPSTTPSPPQAPNAPAGGAPSPAR